MSFFRRKPRSLSSLEAYARWAAEYPPHAHNALMRAEEAAMRDLLPPLAGRVVLDAACGSGRYARLALEGGARWVIATDNSPDMLRRMTTPPVLESGSAADRRTQHTALSTLEALPLPSASVDVALCGLAIGHLPRIDRALAELGRVLVPGGTALISDVHPFHFLSGAQRTFSSGGRTYAVEHTVHLYSAVHDAARSAGLRIDAVREPPLLPDDRSADAPQVPVAIVYRLVKG